MLKSPNRREYQGIWVHQTRCVIDPDGGNYSRSWAVLAARQLERLARARLMRYSTGDAVPLAIIAPARLVATSQLVGLGKRPRPRKVNTSPSSNACARARARERYRHRMAGNQHFDPLRAQRRGRILMLKSPKSPGVSGNWGSQTRC